MHLDDRAGEDLKRVAHGVGIVRPRPWVHDQPVDAGAGLVDHLDEVALAVRLPAADGQLQILGPVVDHRLELRQRRRPVVGRVALAEHAQVDPVQDRDLHGPERLLAGGLRNPPGSDSLGRVRVPRAIALLVILGLLTGSGGAVLASSHGPTPHASTTITIWLKRDARLWHTKRIVTAGFPVRTAVRALFAGPNGSESAAGVKTAVPAGVRLLSSSVAHGVATVNVNPKFASPATRRQIRMRLAQLTFTVTQFPNARAVHLEFNGSAVTSIGGVTVPRHMRRADFRRLVP